MMFIMIGVMAAGILAGYLFRDRKRLLARIGKLNMGVIYLLLFAMGLSVGQDETIMSNLGGLGLLGILISFCSIAGSVLLAWVVYKYFFTVRRREERP